MARRIVMVWVAVALGMWGGCGGGGKTSSGPSDSGRITVRNQSKAIIDVSYVYEEWGLVEEVVNPGETKDVSQGDLKNGTEIMVTLKARSSPDDMNGWYHAQPSSEVKITIHGNVTIIAKGPLVFGGNVPYEIQ